MPQCSAINCANRPEKGFKLFRFPAEESRRQKWIEYCGRKDWVPTKNSALCELHFSEDQFRTDRTEEGKKQLYRSAIPSVLVQPQPGLTTSRGRKKCMFSTHTQNLITEEPKKKEHTKFKARNIDNLHPLVKKTKRWTHLPKVDWSYDHPYSKRRRIYFEVIESCVLTGESAGRNDDQKPQDFSPTSQGTDDKRLLTDRLQDKVEESVNADARFCNGVEPGSDLNVEELGDAIQNVVQTKMELRRQLMDLCGRKENAEQGGCRNMEAFCSDLQDDLQVLDLYMTVDEVNDGYVADGEEHNGCSDVRSVEMEARNGLMKRLEGLELLEKTLKMQLTKKMHAEKESREKSCLEVDEICQTTTPEEGECTETEENGKFPQENPIIRVFDSGVEIPSADSQDTDNRSDQMSALSAVENGSTESSTETSSNGFVCESCGKMFASFYQMHSHQRMHLGKKRQPRVCYICHKSFLLLGRHLRTHSGERPYRCLHCGRQFSRLDNLQNHIRSHVNRARKRHACDRCGAEFPDQHELRLHQRTHRGETLYSCVHCDRKFLYRNVWKTHVKSHLRRKQFLCNVCGKQFVQANNLRDHIAGVHSDERSHECHVCGKSFVRAISLRLHANSHTGNRPHSCDRCSKRFFSPGSLTAHMRIHYGETPFVCGICWKCFRYSCHLKIHMRVHTGEKPYQCLICSKSFAQNGNLKEHMRIHLQTSAQEEL